MRFQTARFEAREWTARRGRKASERGALPMSLVIAFGVLAFFVAWFIGGNLALRRAMRGMASEEVGRARSLFTKQREQDKQLLGLLCRVVADSPQLKAIVDTPGIDEQSISDILSDLRQLTGVEMLAVLTPAARVQAAVGVDGLGGADLGGAFLVANQTTPAEEASGLWVMGGRVLSVTAVAIRLRDRPLGYIVAGNSVASPALEMIYQMTGTGVAMIQANKVVAAAPVDPGFRAAFDALAAEPSLFEIGEVQSQGTRYVAALTEVNAAPASARLRMAWLREADQPLKHFRWLSLVLFWLPLVSAILLACGIILRGRQSS